MAKDYRPYYFQVFNNLTKSEKQRLRAMFSLYAHDSVYLQKDVAEPWQDRVYFYKENTWLLFLSENSTSYSDLLYEIIPDKNFFLFRIGEDFVTSAESEVLQWLDFHLD